MKKIFLLMLASLLCTTTMFAQREGRPQSQRGEGREVKHKVAIKKNSFYLGIKAGADFTTMTQPDECDLYDGAGFGYSGGIVGRVRFGQASSRSMGGTGLLGAGLELKYKLNTVKTIGTDEEGEANADLSIGYFEVPLYVQVYPFYKTNGMSNFYVEVGPDFAGTMSRSPKSLTVETPGGAYGGYKYHLDDDQSSLKGMDIRLMAGIGYDFAIKGGNNSKKHLVGVNARYYMGTSKLAGNLNSKMNTFEVSLSWMFNVGNF